MPPKARRPPSVSMKIDRHGNSGRIMGSMDENQSREQFDSGLKKIRLEIKSRLVPHGLFGTVTDVASASTEGVPDASRIEIHVKGRMVGKSFNRSQIEGCYLRVAGTVLSDIIAMIDEVSTAEPKQVGS